MQDVQLPGQNGSGFATFTAANTTLAKILLDIWEPQVMAAVSGESAIPGEDGVRQRVFTGGQRVIDGSISSTDGTNRDVNIYFGRQTSLYANMGTVTISSQNIVNRNSGSFITDGYQVGDAIMLFGSGVAGNNGLLAQVTAVAASTLTVTGTPWTNGTEGAGFRILRVSQRTRRQILANAGAGSSSVAAVALMGGTQDPATAPQPDTGWSLGTLDLLLVAMVATISALPARVDVHCQCVRY